MKRWEGENRLEEDELRFLKMLWKLKAPFRVKILVWQLLHGRLPTKVNLSARNIIHVDQGSQCVFCANSLETKKHLFLNFKLYLVNVFWQNMWESVSIQKC
jgi:hypothetical protein